MTTLDWEEESCLICGKVNKCPKIASTISLGGPDLDTRPAQMVRSNIRYIMQRCPSCGYCAPRLSEGPRRIKEIVQSEAYRQQISQETYPELAKSFLCWAIIQEAVGGYSDAGWAAVRAAWVCDDAKAVEPYRLCRIRAIQLLRRSKAAGKAFAEGAGLEEAILADLLRRSGQFDQAEAACQEGLKKNPEAVIQQILALQIALAKRQDASCHRVDEATTPAQNQ
ncbi:MAG: hypothetical protein ABSB61_07715 [Anaerolineales bacterium]|jgi:hypothetical protein